jgi:hypothetical protein
VLKERKQMLKGVLAGSLTTAIVTLLLLVAISAAAAPMPGSREYVVRINENLGVNEAMGNAAPAPNLAPKVNVEVTLERFNPDTGLYADPVHLYTHNLVVNSGLELIQAQLTTANTSYTKYISVSTSASAPDAAWTVIPSEITTGGLARAEDTSIADNGVGSYIVDYQFTASATHTNVQLTGLNWEGTPGGDGHLFAAATFTPVTLNSGDKLTEQWTVTAQSA